MRNRLWLVPSLLLLVACAFVLINNISYAKGIEPGAEALAALDDDWSKAAVARDVDRVASFYADDAVIYPPNEKRVIGRAAARNMWASLLADPNFTISWKTESAGVDNNTGFTAGSYQSTLKSADGKTTTETGKYLAVWRKGKDGKWKAIHDMWNADSK